MAGNRLVISAALLGAASGLRSFSALAALAARDRLGGRLSRPAILLAAAGELVADKLPQTPARTEPGPFAVRVATGALAGGRLGGRRGAMAGAAASAGATVAGYLARRAVARDTRLPDPAVGAVEDVLALSVAMLGARGE
jgi:uncharacterized membrane protein